jgi:low temperature requirement protein LtrA
LAIDLGTPWAAVHHTRQGSAGCGGICPKCFGLFTLILLGESVVAALQGMESQDDWTAVAAAACILASSFWVWAFSVW